MKYLYGCPSGQGGRLKICWRKPHGFEPHTVQIFHLYIIFFYNFMTKSVLTSERKTIRATITELTTGVIL